MMPKTLAVALAILTMLSLAELSRAASAGLMSHLAASAAQGALEARMSEHIAGLCRRGGAHTEIACRRHLETAGF